METAQKKKNKNYLSILFLLFNIALLFYLVATDEQLQGSAAGGFQQFQLPILGIAVLFMMIYIAFDVIKIYRLILYYTGRREVLLSIRISILGKYYDGITPMATGGQPFQIYEMTKRDISGAHSSGTILMKYFVYQMVFCVYGFFCVVYNLIVGAQLQVIHYILAILAIIVNFAMPFTVFLFATHEKAAQKLLGFVLNLGIKLRLVKKPDEVKENVHNTVSQFVVAFDELKKDWRKLLELYVLSFIEIAFYIVIPFVIYASYNPAIFNDLSVFATMMRFSCVYLFVYFVMSVWPFPGGSGAAEFGFGWMMGSFFPQSSVSLAIVLWRVITYYFPIAWGFCIVLKDTISQSLKTRSK